MQEIIHWRYGELGLSEDLFLDRGFGERFAPPCQWLEIVCARPEAQAVARVDSGTFERLTGRASNWNKRRKRYFFW